MYDAVIDPYCYEGTTILKNIPDLHDQISLDTFEAAMTTQRSDEPLPRGLLSITHYCAIHNHLFQDVYTWAGSFRTVRISKGGNTFCYPEYITQEMKKLFDDLKRQKYFQELSTNNFVSGVANFLSILNAIHPFREGNGRTQTIFLMLLAGRAGHQFNLKKFIPSCFMNAMISSFEKDEKLLIRELKRLIA